MPASTIPAAPVRPPSPQKLRELLDGGAQVMPLTVEQYHAMIANGTLAEGEPYELIAGQIVRKLRHTVGADPVTVGDRHIWTVSTLEELNEHLKPHGCYIRTQQPVSLPPINEPEPDGAIVRGDKDAYRSRKPLPADVLCVIEVADATLRYDRTTKTALYAEAQLPLYVIINLVDNVVEAYMQPQPELERFGHAVTLKPGDTLQLPTADGNMIDVKVASLLP